MIWVLRGLVAMVLIGSGILKAADPTPVLPASWAWAASALDLLPWVEIAAGLLLLSELPLRWTAWPATLLCLGFVAVTGLRLAIEGGAADCGCFGVLSSPLDQWHLVGVCVLAALSVGLLLGGRRHPDRLAGLKAT